MQRTRRTPRHRGRRAEVRASRFTRVRAVLAGALVLGVGGTLTLAAWTDTESVRGAFAASKFGIVGSSDGVTFTDHPASGPAALSFVVTPTALSPGVTSYAKFVVKTTADTTVPGTLSLAGATVTGTGLDTYLRYGVRTIPVASPCSETTFAAGSSVVAAASLLTAAGAGSQALAAAGGAPVAYCFAVTLPAGTPNAAQGLTTTASWTFTATSSS
ncbi:hypothetical protein SD72_10955 [Leucobacter komagatae]|uniref:Ribosomally synthesized peptide with SipW-like signal peptide n=1 Tax=Leucobacter komagatae TaxID=55969 RepID=A0A0D0IRU2_9MICO|nr:hypothetical protein SD72_10955 [Leucobacter komagatae]